MQMSLTLLEGKGESQGSETSSNSNLLNFSEWLHTVIVRPFGEFIPAVVKKVCDSLELEDLQIDMDLEHYSKKKDMPSKKRRRNDAGEPC